MLAGEHHDRHCECTLAPVDGMGEVDSSDASSDRQVLLFDAAAFSFGGQLNGYKAGELAATFVFAHDRSIGAGQEVNRWAYLTLS